MSFTVLKIGILSYLQAEVAPMSDLDVGRIRALRILELCIAAEAGANVSGSIALGPHMNRLKD
jgi:hypothetical protein